MDSVFGAFAGRGHFDDAGVKAGDGFDEISLLLHHVFDVLVDHGDLVESCGEECDACGIEELAGSFPLEVFLGCGAAHDAARAVCRGVEGGGVAFAADDVGGRGHGSWNDAEGPLGGRGCAFAVDDEFLAAVFFLPCEVVVVLDGKQNGNTEIAGDMPVDAGVIRGCVVSHQFHGGPVFPAFGGVEVEPCEVAEFRGNLASASGLSDLAEMFADLCAGAAAAAVGEEGKVVAGGEVEAFYGDIQLAKFDKVIAAAACAELAPCLVLEALGERAEVPVAVHDLVLAARFFEFRADAEAGFGFDGASEEVDPVTEGFGGKVEDGESYAAGDVYADSIGDDGVSCGEDAADGDAIADVRIGHERGMNGDRQLRGISHLRDGIAFEANAPLEVRRGRGGQSLRGVFHRGLGEVAEMDVAEVQFGVATDRFDGLGDGGLADSGLASALDRGLYAGSVVHGFSRGKGCRRFRGGRGGRGRAAQGVRGGERSAGPWHRCLGACSVRLPSLR